MRVHTPPSWQAVMSQSADKVVELMPSFAALDEKGRYLHWEEFRWRVPPTVDKDVAWCVTKLARMAQLRSLPDLVSEGGHVMKYCVPDSLQGYLHTIDRLCAPLLQANDATTVSNAERNRYLVESLMMEEAISSSQLEGAATTRKVAKEMLETERSPRNEDERMIFNNFMLMKIAKHSKDEEISLDLIRYFHSIATQGTEKNTVTPGEFRVTDDVYVADANDEVVHQPPQAIKLISRLQRVCDFANAHHDGLEGRPFIHPAVKAIILHFMIGYEHPFADGNGRTARAIFYWFMLKKGYWPFEYISISALLKKAPIKYGESYLYSETDDFDLTYFVDYQLRIISRAIDQFLNYLEKKKREYYELMTWLDNVGIAGKLNYRQGQLLRKAIRSPGRVFTVKEIKNDFNVSDNTARADLMLLVKLKVLAQAKEGKTVQFIARADAQSNLKSK